MTKSFETRTTVESRERAKGRCRVESIPPEQIEVGSLTHSSSATGSGSGCASVTNGIPQFSAVELEGDQCRIALTELSTWFESYVQQYEAVGFRGRYLWKWCLYGLRSLTLTSVSESLRDHLIDTKLLAVLFGVLLDDVADQRQDRVFLNQLIAGTIEGKLRSHHFADRSTHAYAELTYRVWDEFLARVSGYPRHVEFQELLDYDNRQVVNTMVYSQLVNANVTLMNEEEHDVYSPHNMQMISFSTLDLMCSPEFDHREVGQLRAAMWHGQCMGRIGNLISTWERELRDRDFSSGVFAVLADRYPSITMDMLIGNPDSIISTLTRDRIADVFLEKWVRHRDLFESRVAAVRSVNLSDYLKGLTQLLRMEMGSCGRK